MKFLATGVFVKLWVVFSGKSIGIQRHEALVGLGWDATMQCKESNGSGVMANSGSCWPGSQ